MAIQAVLSSATPYLHLMRLRNGRAYLESMQVGELTFYQLRVAAERNPPASFQLPGCPFRLAPEDRDEDVPGIRFTNLWMDSYYYRRGSSCTVTLFHCPPLRGMQNALFERSFPTTTVASISIDVAHRLLNTYRMRQERGLMLLYDDEPVWQPDRVRLEWLSDYQVWEGASGQDWVRAFVNKGRSYASTESPDADHKSALLLLFRQRDRLLAPPYIVLSEEHYHIGRLMNLIALCQPMLSSDLHVHLYTYLLWLATCAVSDESYGQDRLLGQVRRLHVTQAIVAATAANVLTPGYLHQVMEKHDVIPIRLLPDIVVPLKRQQLHDMPASFWNAVTAWHKARTTESALQAINALKGV